MFTINVGLGRGGLVKWSFGPLHHICSELESPAPFVFLGLRPSSNPQIECGRSSGWDRSQAEPRLQTALQGLNPELPGEGARCFVCPRTEVQEAILTVKCNAHCKENKESHLACFSIEMEEELHPDQLPG